MAKVTYISGNDHSEATLPSFSKLACLAHLHIPESLLMENDPEDADAAWDCEVLHGTVFTTVRLISPEDGEPIYFVGLTNEWEGVKSTHC